MLQAAPRPVNPGQCNGMCAAGCSKATLMGMQNSELLAGMVLQMRTVCVGS